MSVYDLDASVIIDGNVDITPFVQSIDRTHSICNVMQNVTLVCAPSLKTFLDANHIALRTYEPVTISEAGVLVCTGYITKVNPARKPDFTITISISDKYKKARDYYIDDPNWETAGETIAGLAQTLLDLCDLELVLDSLQFNAVTLPPGQPLGLNDVDTDLQNIVAYGTGIVYTDPHGRVHLQKGPKASNLHFTTANFVASGVFQDVAEQAGEIFSDENSRDTVQVWGTQPYWVHLEHGQSPYIVSERSVDIGLAVPKTILYISPLIQTQAEADRLSADMINEVGKIDHTITVTCGGDPYIKVGLLARLDLDIETNIIQTSAKITSVKSKMDKTGYTMTVTLDEFCPKFAGWSLASRFMPLYAGTRKHGIYRSLDHGVTWADFNTGLPSGIKYVKKMAFDSQNEGMSIVNGGVYHSDGITWTVCELPAPVNAALDSPAPTYGIPVGVDSVSDGTFNVLATNSIEFALPSGVTQLRNRTWLYTTSSSGLFASDWTSQAVHDDTDYNFYGLDVNSKSGFPYILTKKFDDPNFYLANVQLRLGGSNVITRGTSILGEIIVQSYTVEPADEAGFVSVSNRNPQEYSRILRFTQGSPRFLSTGIIDPLWPQLGVVVRLVLGLNYPQIPNLFFQPFMGAVIGAAGYGSFDNRGAAYGGTNITLTDYNNGYVDYGINFNKNLLINNPRNIFGGWDVCFFIGHSTFTGGQTNSAMFFNGESHRFDLVRPQTDPDIPWEYENLDTGFVNYPFDLVNLSIGW